MRHAARFLFGALLGVALGYAFVLFTQRAPTERRHVPINVRRPPAPPSEEREPAEEIAAS